MRNVMSTFVAVMASVSAMAQEEERSGQVEMTLEAIVQKTMVETGLSFSYTEEMGLRNKRLYIDPSLLQGKTAYGACLTFCRQAGYAVFARQVGEKKIYRIASVAWAPKEDPRAFDRVEDLPEEDEFCVLTLKPRNVNVRDVHAALICVMTQPNGILQIEASSTIVLYDYAPKLRQLAKLVRKMDENSGAKDYWVTFTLIRATGEQGVEAAEIPKKLEGFADLLKSQAIYSSYEFIDTCLIRVDLRQGNLLPGVPGHPAANPRGVFGGGGYAVSFSPGVGDGGMILLRNFVMSVGQEQDVLSTNLALRNGRRGIAGVCRPLNAAAPVILAVQVDAIE